jgi:hypothetical protein
MDVEECRVARRDPDVENTHWPSLELEAVPGLTVHRHGGLCGERGATERGYQEQHKPP